MLTALSLRAVSRGIHLEGINYSHSLLRNHILATTNLLVQDFKKGKEKNPSKSLVSKTL